MKHVPLRLPVYLTVAVVALVAAGIVVGLTLDTRTTPHQPAVVPGKPPVPTDLPAPYGPKIARRVPELAAREHRRDAAARARVLADDAVVQYYRGLALLWAGYPSDAAAALEPAKKLGRNTVDPGQGRQPAPPELLPADLRPELSGLRPVPTERAALARLPAPGRGSPGSRRSSSTGAQRACAPNDVEAQVAAAVGLFDEDNLTPAFSHLGPLVQRFPRSQIVRYYLGLLLAWTGQGPAAIKQFEKTVSLGPDTALGKAATRS